MMEWIKLILLGAYIYCGGMANSFLKHNILKMETVYVFNFWGFLTEKMILAVLFGWLTIPIALVLRYGFGVGKPEEI